MDTNEENQNLKPENTAYGADQITALEGLEAVRKRPGMYIGGTDSPALHHLVYEVIDNSIDEHLAGHCSEVTVEITEKNGIRVTDDGRGIPVDMHTKLQKSALEVVMTVLHAGGKFDKDSYKVSGGLHGVGVSCVNAVSTLLKAEVHRKGKVYVQEYSKGKPLYDVKEVGVTDKRGTIIEFQPDGEILEVLVYSFDTLSARLRELSFLNRGLKLILIDHREIDDETNKPREEVYLSEGGLREFVEYLDASRQKLIEEPIHVTGTEKNVEVEVALQYNTSYTENVLSFVNNINTRDGGTHVSGFRRAVNRLFKQYGEENGYFNKLKFAISGDDFREGLTAIISVKIAEPQFKSQTKGELMNSEVTGAVSRIVGDIFKHYLEENPKQATKITD